MRQPKPWFRQQSKRWYLQINGKQVNLGPDRESAFETFHRLMSGQGAAQAGISARCLVDRYAVWIDAHRAQSTAESSKPILAASASPLAPSAD